LIRFRWVESCYEAIGFRTKVVGFLVSGFWFQGFGFRVLVSGFWFQGLGSRVPRFRVEIEQINDFNF
jgi:hypothetical protein